MRQFLDDVGSEEEGEGTGEGEGGEEGDDVLARADARVKDLQMAEAAEMKR